MEIKPVGDMLMVVPQNLVDRQILQFMASDLLRPKDFSYWDVKPDSVENDGRIWVAWSKKGERPNCRLDAFAIYQGAYGYGIDLFPKPGD